LVTPIESDTDFNARFRPSVLTSVPGVEPYFLNQIGLAVLYDAVFGGVVIDDVTLGRSDIAGFDPSEIWRTVAPLALLSPLGHVYVSGAKSNV